MAVPFVNEHVEEGQPKVQLCHAGVQVVPESCNFKKELGRYCIQPPLQSVKVGEVTPANVVKALAVLRLEWMAFYRDYNLDSFEYLVDGFERSQLIRISPYKAESADATA
jgi:hypothetical protein